MQPQRYPCHPWRFSIASLNPQICAPSPMNNWLIWLAKSATSLCTLLPRLVATWVPTLVQSSYQLPCTVFLKALPMPFCGTPAIRPTCTKFSRDASLGLHDFVNKTAFRVTPAAKKAVTTSLRTVTHQLCCHTLTVLPLRATTVHRRCATLLLSLATAQ